MGSYITAAQVVIYTGTALTTAELNEMIDEVEDTVVDMCAARGVTASSTNGLCKAAVRLMVKAEILERGIFDGGILKALDRTTFRDDVNSEKLREQANALIDEFVEISGGMEALSSEDVSETVVRRDHEMPSINPDQSKIPEYHDRASETGNQDTDLEDD